jgi:hypothetical protein
MTQLTSGHRIRDPGPSERVASTRDCRNPEWARLD